MIVKDTKSDGWKAFERLPEVLEITAGVFAEQGERLKEVLEGSPSGITLAEVANIHEFGALLKNKDGDVIGEIPARSFIRAWFDENEARIQGMYLKLLDKHGPEQWETAVQQLALWIQGEIQRRIRRGIDPPLAESTKERKKSSKPLIDTGQLVASIMAKVNGRFART